MIHREGKIPTFSQCFKAVKSGQTRAIERAKIPQPILKNPSKIPPKKVPIRPLESTHPPRMLQPILKKKTPIDRVKIPAEWHPIPASNKVKPKSIKLETKFGRILPLTYDTKYDTT